MEFTIIFTKAFAFMLVVAWPLLSSLILSIVLLGQVVGRLEGWKPFNSLYWTFITATTVGYGDIRPGRRVSRVLTILIVFIGLIFTGILVSMAVETTSRVFAEVADTEEVRTKFEKLIKSH